MKKEDLFTELEKEEKIIDEKSFKRISDKHKGVYEKLRKCVDELIALYIRSLSDFEKAFDICRVMDERLFKAAQIFNLIYDEFYFENKIVNYVKAVFHKGICPNCNFRVCVGNKIEESEKSIFENGLDPVKESRKCFKPPKYDEIVGNERI